MKKAPFPVPDNEKSRLHCLQKYDVLNNITESEYDFITRMASQICGTPVALITLLDKTRQWVKSSFGFDVPSLPREISFCNYTILDPDHVNVVEDLRQDKRYKSNPLVTGHPNAVFYAGAPIVTPDGFVLGSICVLDAEKKSLTNDQKDALKALARQTITTMELRRKNKVLKSTEQKLRSSNKKLEDFAKLVSHDMKTPLANIVMLSKGFRNNFKEILNDQSGEYIKIIERSSLELLDFIDQMLRKSKQISNSDSRKPANTLKVLNKTIRFLAPPKDIEIKIEGKFMNIAIDEISLQQLFQNLITNAIKYNDKPNGYVRIFGEFDKTHHYFQISDNGTGIAGPDLEKIFTSQTLNKADRYGNHGTGIGLTEVMSILKCAEGKISVASQPGIGTDFTISMPHGQDILAAV